jgi:cell division protein FtsW (lipid II flippase)
LADALAATSILMADARATPVAAAKNEAMRALLQTAGWQWAAWALIGLALLNLSRRVGSAAAGVAFALAAWAAAAWIGRVPWPLASERAFVLARESAAPLAMPADFVLWLLGAAAAVLIFSPGLRKPLASRAQRPASSIGYPGLIFATGIGWLLLLDLSANGNPSNRYLGLYHQGHLWLAMLTFSLVAFLRQPLGRMLAWTLSLIDGVANGVGRRLGVAGAAAALLGLTLLLTGALGALLLNVRQLTSEIGRLWLVVGAAWFFFLRGTPLTERLARSGTSLASLARYVWPLLFVVTVLIGAMLITRDMGPLLIAGYGAGAFVAASVAMWWYQRRATVAPAYALAVMLFAAWIVGITYALFRLGSIDDVAAGRLESVAAPLASANDQLALVTWFQRAAPAAGFGPGAIPWCGFGASGAYAGVPAQIQSDYTFALVGMFGWSATWAFTIGCAVWLHWLIARHGRATRGEPRFVRSGDRMSNDDQAFLSWICVTWAVLALCQLAVTVAGNLAVIPLTGVTFPFVSFGMTSLVMNMAMLALAINVNAEGRGDG